MADDPRAYSSGTEKALFEVARGRCYFPDCDIPTTVFVEGQPSVNVQIAHIEGAYRNSARYNSGMTDRERAGFPNLMLMCTPHHNLIDRIQPEDYPVERLREFKHGRESEETRSALSEFTEEQLTAAIESAVSSIRTTREIRVEVKSGIFIGNAAITGPLGEMQTVIDANPHLASELQCIVTIIRNVGGLASSVEDVALYYRVASTEAEMNWSGQNTFPLHNPTLPYMLEVGASCKWLISLESFEVARQAARAAGTEFTHFRVDVRLGSGETISSETYSAEKLAAE